MNFTTLSRARASRRSGFTLIELLTVIGIISLLAALIIPLAGIANANKRKAEARAMIDMIDAAIGQYKIKKGFYPPDNTVNGVTKSYPNPLFYELWGTTVINAGQYGENFKAGEYITTNLMGSIFNVSGFLNASGDPTEVYNFLPTIKQNQLANLTNTGNILTPAWVLACKSPGPAAITTTIGGVKINQVQYVVSSPTNHPTSYDLWVDIVVGGKTNRVSNWNKDPILVFYN